MKNKDYEEAYGNLAIYHFIKIKPQDSDKFSIVNITGVNLELDEYKRKSARIDNLHFYNSI
jgi:hypothetical protein